MVYTARVVSTSHASGRDNDVALTEMELLEQNQRRLGSLTGRMTTILNGFDRRLVKLESSILPIHKSTQTLSRISSNVSEVQKELDTSLRHYGVVVDDEPEILRGPDPRNPWPYLEAIQRVIKEANEAPGGEASQAGSKRHRLTEQGARKVAELVREYTAAESRAIDPFSYTQQGLALPGVSNECLTSDKALLQFLYTLPEMQHNATASAFALALQSYASVRSTYLTASLDAHMKRVVHIAAMTQQDSVPAPREAHVDYQRGTLPVQEFCAVMLSMVQQEQNAIATLFQGMAWEGWRGKTATGVLQPLVQAVNAMMPMLLPRLHHGLNAHRYMVLDFIAQTQAVFGVDGQKWIAALQGTQCDTCSFTSVLGSVRQDALLFFPELLRDIKIIPVQQNHDALQVGVSDIARLGMVLLRGLVCFQDVMLFLLQTMGSKNWVEGQASAMSPDALWADYVKDFMLSIVTSLERTVAAIPQPTVASIFLLNNVTFLQKDLRALAQALPPPVMNAAEHVVTHALRTAHTSYLESWNVVVQALVDDQSAARSGPMGKFAVLSDRSKPDAFARFYEYLQQMEQIHRTHPLQRDTGLADSLRNDVTRLISPLYAVTLSKQRSTSQRSARWSERDLDQWIAQLYL